MDAATLDAMYKRIISSGGECEVPSSPEIPAIAFDSQESEERFLELIAREQVDPSPEQQPGVSHWSFVAGEWVQTQG